MENESAELLQTLLVAQALTLASVMEAAGNSFKSDHYIGDAVKAITQQREVILRRFAESR